MQQLSARIVCDTVMFHCTMYLWLKTNVTGRHVSPPPEWGAALLQQPSDVVKLQVAILANVPLHKATLREECSFGN